MILRGFIWEAFATTTPLDASPAPFSPCARQQTGCRWRIAQVFDLWKAGGGFFLHADFHEGFRVAERAHGIGPAPKEL